MVLPRGGNASAYGPILADREAHAGKPPLPLRLGNVSVRVTDSVGVPRLARLLYTGAGWASLNFIVPADSASGPAQIEIVRADGSRSVTHAIIADVAPGLFTATYDGRGAAAGEVKQRFPDGHERTFPPSECTANGCRTVPIPLSPGISTTAQFFGTGFRFAGPAANIRAWIGAVPVRVLSHGPTDTPGTDQLRIAIPFELAGTGEADLIFAVNGAISNVVRVNCGRFK